MHEFRFQNGIAVFCMFFLRGERDFQLSTWIVHMNIGPFKISKFLGIESLTQYTLYYASSARYEEYDHQGYDLQGKKWMKQSALGNKKDLIDEAVGQEDDVDYMRTIYDAVNDRDVVLSDRDLEILRRIQAGAYAHPELEAYPDYIPFNTHKGVREKHSLHQGTEPKRRFTPSKWERMKVLKMVKDIQEGRLQTTAQAKKRAMHGHKKELKMLWKDDDTNVCMHPLLLAFVVVAAVFCADD